VAPYRGPGLHVEADVILYRILVAGVDEPDIEIVAGMGLVAEQYAGIAFHVELAV